MMHAAIPCRSALYIPAINERAIAKAKGLAADALILDLEDSIAPERKIEARERACAAVRTGGFGPRAVVIRINGLDTPWGLDDLAAAALVVPDAVLVPKVEDPATVTKASALLAEAGAPAATRLWVMVETPRAILAAGAIAAAGSGPGGRLDCSVMGTNDLLKDLRASARPGRAALDTSLSLALLAARAHGLAILDGVYNQIADAEGFEGECRDGRTRGFDGKTLIHPGQIEACNRIYSPDPDALAEARAVIAAFAVPEARDKGVVSLNGRMVERLHLAEAERLVAQADAIAARANPGG